MIEKQCIVCKKSFKVFPYRKDSALFCSVKCCDVSKIGRETSETTKQKIREVAKEKGFGKWMKGRRNSPATEFKKGQASWSKGLKLPKMTNGGNPNWKGNDVGYHGIHKWIYRHKGSPKLCEHCGKIKGKLYWANKDHKYSRDLNDWMQLCASCHKKYDIASGLVTGNSKNNKSCNLTN